MIIWQKIVIVIVLSAGIAMGVFWASLQIWGNWYDEWSGYNASLSAGDGFCNIAIVPVVGEITTYTAATEDENGSAPLSTSMSDTLSLLGELEYDMSILGVLVVIDSWGGSPAASMLIADGLKNSSMPVAAFVLDVAASGGYYVATGADTIIASPFSDIGSIGLTMSYLDYSRQNADAGLEYVSLSSGRFKDSGDPDKPLTTEERKLFERDLKIYHDTFVKEVAANRNLPVEDVAELADGSTLPAPLALEKGLIDQIGRKEDVREWFADQLGVANAGDIVFCQ